MKNSDAFLTVYLARLKCYIYIILNVELKLMTI
jgi:hypothetical protein